MELFFGPTFEDFVKIIGISGWIDKNQLWDHVHIKVPDPSGYYKNIPYPPDLCLRVSRWSCDPAHTFGYLGAPGWSLDYPDGFIFLREDDYVYARMKWGH